MRRTAYVALGSNLSSAAGTPAATLTAAIKRLRNLGEVTARSSFYETEPVGNAAQPHFTNAVVALSTALAPEALLNSLLSIEREFGRERSGNVRNAPRTLDLDLLLLDNLILDSPFLTLPHPAIAGRRFVLAPLAEIAPRLVHPVLKKEISQLLTELPDSGENRISAVAIP